MIRRQFKTAKKKITSRRNNARFPEKKDVKGRHLGNANKKTRRVQMGRGASEDASVCMLVCKKQNKSL